MESKMRQANPKTLLILVIFLNGVFAVSVFAQQNGDTNIEYESGVLDISETPQEIVRQPWCLLTARLAYGVGSGSFIGDWNFEGDSESNDRVNPPADSDDPRSEPVHDFHDETVEMKSIDQYAIYPEVFFMPTKGRRFTVSLSSPMGGGSGELIGYVFHNFKFRYQFFLIKAGLGYQWFANTSKSTSFMLLSHFGGGQFWMFIEPNDDRNNAKTLPLQAWEFDISIAVLHRLDNRFILGGSLEMWLMKFSGDVGSGGYLDGSVSGYLEGFRANLMAGYAL